MKLTPAFRWLAFANCAFAEHVLHDREPGISWREESSLLEKRDVCSQTLGPGRIANICTPSNTLCCVTIGQDFPRCEQHLGQGWCCVGGTNSSCYIDQPSVCNQENSVACTQLTPGTTKACCPAFTVCAGAFNHSQSKVRCNAAAVDLIQAQSSLGATPSSTAGQSGTTTNSMTSSSAASSLAASLSPTSTSSVSSPPRNAPRRLSGGDIAGIALGLTMAALAGIGLSWALRRNRKMESNYIRRNVKPVELPAEMPYTMIQNYDSTYPLTQELDVQRASNV